jgi:hypothetical protein
VCGSIIFRAYWTFIPSIVLIPMVFNREAWTPLASRLGAQTLYVFVVIFVGFGVKYYVLVAHAGLLYSRIRRCLEAKEIVGVMVYKDAGWWTMWYAVELEGILQQEKTTSGLLLMCW